MRYRNSPKSESAEKSDNKLSLKLLDELQDKIISARCGSNRAYIAALRIVAQLQADVREKVLTSGSRRENDRAIPWRTPGHAKCKLSKLLPFVNVVVNYPFFYKGGLKERIKNVNRKKRGICCCM